MLPGKRLEIGAYRISIVLIINLTNLIGDFMDQVREDIKLSTGRVVKHSKMDNGAQLATPTPGSYEMTNSEWLEYCSIINLKIDITA